MVLSPMRYKSHTWNYNPSSIKLLSQKEVIQQKIPMADNVLQNFGRNARVITGKGYLVGEDCFSQYDEMWKLHCSRESGILSVPDFAVMRACFTHLEIVGEPTDKMITYSFTFVEEMDTQREKSPITFHIVEGNQSLWDIGYIHSVTVEELLRLNPQYKNPFDVKENDEVVLC